MKYSKADIEKATAQLREWLKPGDTLYTILEHVSRSGMSRTIRVVLPMKDSETGETYFLHPNYSVAVVLGESRAKQGDGIKVSGCGMDMGFHLVYSLSSHLFPDGFGKIMRKEGLEDIRPSTKEQAAELYAQGYRANGRNGDDSGWDNDGGYALKHRWM